MAKNLGYSYIVFDDLPNIANRASPRRPDASRRRPLVECFGRTSPVSLYTSVESQTTKE
jgi:hypothetical protein